MRDDIKNTGTMLQTDADGFLVKTASVNKIQPTWRPAVDAVVEAYKTHLGSDLHSVYLRGSVAKGEAIEGVSDIDTIAVVKTPKDNVNRDWMAGFQKWFRREYLFVSDVEIVLDSLESLGRGNKIMIKTQAVCLYGSDLSEELPPLKPGADTVMHAPRLGKEINDVYEFLQTAEDQQRIRQKCAWIMKRILRSGCELVMERSGKYTRDLYPCYELFSQYYPEKSESMYGALELAINPSNDADEIIEVLQGIGAWVAQEASNVFGETS